jgi:cysteinyl-tRNA synthetase
MTLQLYDTMAREKRPFEPRDPARVTMYVCGPTVYNHVHIGNARPVVVFDVLFRLLRKLYGEQAVIYARNITDVDDKINAKAVEEGVDIKVITDRFTEYYQEQMAALGALPPTFEPRATDHISDMKRMILALIKEGCAYEAEGHVLFDVSAYGAYGKLSGRDLDEMIAGARVEVAPYKRNPADFVLWKPSKPGEPKWAGLEGHFGPGRPGWHIECSAMIEKNLGLPIDIHGGGIDLTFPHHENEMAQGVCAHGGAHDQSVEYSRYWMHNGFLDFSGEKMSKSVGNVVRPHDLLEIYPGEVLRWALLSAHYRQPLDWTDSLLEQSRKNLDYLYGVLLRAERTAASDKVPAAFLDAVLDDINTPKAQSELFALAKAVETEGASAADLLAAGRLIGFLQTDPEEWFMGSADDNLKAKVDALLAERFTARQSKDFATADRIRGELDALGVIVMDGPQGATWRMKD